MTRFQELDEQLAARGWHYDSANQEFRDGTRALEWEDVSGLVPEFTLDELASYEDQKFDELKARRVSAKCD